MAAIMKTIFLLLCLLASASAQTFKWQQTAPVPVFTHDNASLSQMRGDTAGNCALGIEYRQLGSVAGLQIWWLTAAGKTLHSDLIPGDDLQQPQIISVSAAALLVQFFPASGGQVLRKYTRRGAVVTFKDTILALHESVARDPEILAGPGDRMGFFVTVESVAGRFLGLKRYTVR